MSSVRLVVCILCTDFANVVIWESWRSDDEDASAEQQIGFVTHPRPGLQDHIPYAVDSPVATAWGDDSLVHAELWMLACAVRRFPEAQQFLVVSGDTVPIRTKEDFLAFYVGHDDDVHVSSVVLDQDVRPLHSDSLIEADFDRLYNGHQFMALARHHVEYLLSSPGLDEVLCMGRIPYHTPGHRHNFSPDEVFLQTVLGNRFDHAEFLQTHLVEFIAENRHAKNLTIQDFEELYERSMETDTVFCIRKVSKTMQWSVYQFLGKRGVLNWHRM